MPNSSSPALEITGLVQAGALALDRAALARLPAASQVPDVGVLVRGKRGRGVQLAAIAAHARVDPSALHLHIASSDAAFAVSVPLSEVLAGAVVVYELDGAPLPSAQGGPFRLLCCGHPDECVSVKTLARLTFALAPGRDTRPKDDDEHRRLHAAARARPTP